MPSRKEDKYLKGLEVYLGQRIHGERTRLGLKQAQLAERADKSDKWISRIERHGDNMSLHSLGALARALAVEPGDLLPASQTRHYSTLAREGLALLDEADRDKSPRKLELMVRLLRAIQDSF